MLGLLIPGVGMGGSGSAVEETPNIDLGDGVASGGGRGGGPYQHYSHVGARKPSRKKWKREWRVNEELLVNYLQTFSPAVAVALAEEEIIE